MAGSRARNLSSAFLTMKLPDEVWADNPVATTAKWVYLKQFESKPYPYTVALIVERPLENGIIVPFSSFPVQCSGAAKMEAGFVYTPKTDSAIRRWLNLSTLRGFHPQSFLLVRCANSGRVSSIFRAAFPQKSHLPPV